FLPSGKAKKRVLEAQNAVRKSYPQSGKVIHNLKAEAAGGAALQAHGTPGHGRSAAGQTSRRAACYKQP
ncbi:MAG: hypothetical protein NTX87_09595, partial [Planctomycetota bacterium]|nr:hypothetical protein [Planctomycetota bacterium]